MKSFLKIFKLAVFFIIQSAFAQEIDLNNGLVGHYDFSKKANDISGNGNHGELIKVNLAEDIAGEGRASYRWNSKKDKIILPIDINPVSMPQITMTAWVKPLKNLDKIVVLSNDDRGGDRKIFTQKVDNKVIWCISNGENGLIGKTEVVRNEWVFLVATYDQQSQKASIYVNTDVTSGTAAVDRGADQLYIGANPFGNASFEAIIDEVRIYDRVLKAEEINELYQSIIPKVEEKHADRSFFFIVDAKLAAKEKPNRNAKDLTVFEKGDTLKFTKQVASETDDGATYIEIEWNGKTAYVPQKYLSKVYLENLDKTELQLFIEDKMDFRKWQFWVAMLVMLLVGFGASLKFEVIDRVLGKLTGNDYENVAVFPLISGVVGLLSAIIMVFWQYDLTYYLNNFSIWPSGYGFAAWAFWMFLMIALIGLGFTIFESVKCGKPGHALARIFLQLVLGAMTFLSTFVVTMAVIVIVIFVAVALFLIATAIAVMTRREKKRDMFGNVVD